MRFWLILILTITAGCNWNPGNESAFQNKLTGEKVKRTDTYENWPVLKRYDQNHLARIALPRWIRRCRKVDLVWEDMNKYDRPKNVAASGGVVIVFSFVAVFWLARRDLEFSLMISENNKSLSLKASSLAT